MKKLLNGLYYYIICNKKFIYFISIKILIMIVSVLTNIIVVNKLTVNDYGTYSIANMFIGFVTTFGFSWSSSSIIYYGSKEIGKRGNMNITFWSRNIIMITSLIIVTIAFIVCKDIINSFVGQNVTFLLLLWLYMYVVEDYLRNYFLAVGQQVTSNLISFVAKTLLLLLILFLELSINKLLWFNIISHVVIILFIFKIDTQNFGRFEFNKHWFKKIWSFSIWQLFGFSGLYLINFGDIAVINYFLDSSNVAIYSAAYTLFDYIANGTFLISGFYAAKLTKDYEERSLNKLSIFFNKDRKIMLTFLFIVHLLMIILSDFVIIHLYGSRYIQSSMIFSILLVGSFYKYLSIFYLLIYNISDNYKKLQIINIFRAIINVILNIFFIRIWGLIGPAISTTISMILSYYVMIYFLPEDIRDKVF